MQAERSLSRWIVTASALALATLIPIGGSVSTASAAVRDNRSTITLLPNAAKVLGVEQVRLISKGVARGRGSEVWMPVTGGRVAQQTKLRHGGSLLLKVRRAGRPARQIHLMRFELRLKAKSGILFAREVGTKKSRPFFRLRYSAPALILDTENSAAVLRGARLVPTGAAKKLMRSRLGLGKIGKRPLARLVSRANLKDLKLPEIVPPPLKPLPPEPPLLARPPSAVDVAAASVVWCVRASWIRYIGNGSVSGGATREDSFVVNKANKSEVCDQKRAEVTSAATAYKYFFTFKNGWYDAASGTAALYFTGRVGFRYPKRGIDLGFNDIEVELNGAKSRTIFRMEGQDGTAIQAHRTVFTDNGDPLPALDTSSEPGKAKSGPMLGWLSDETEAGVFADFYMPPNNDFGWVSVEFDLPQPD